MSRAGGQMDRRTYKRLRSRTARQIRIARGVLVPKRICKICGEPGHYSKTCLGQDDHVPKALGRAAELMLEAEQIFRAAGMDGRVTFRVKGDDETT